MNREHTSCAHLDVFIRVVVQLEARTVIVPVAKPLTNQAEATLLAAKLRRRALELTRGTQAQQCPHQTIIQVYTDIHRWAQGGRRESLPLSLRPLGGATPTPLSRKSDTLPGKCNRKTHKNGIFIIHFKPFWRKHTPSDPKNTDTLPPARYSLRV